MQPIDWEAVATLHERDDAGSELQYNFSVRESGPLRDLVRAVAAMDASARARLVIEIDGGPSLNVVEVMDIARREGLA